jgi:eukaryotic-like serine/threonine-protein kinase
MSDSPSIPNRASETRPSHTLEIAHVLFTDIVGYSKLPMDEQEQLLTQLQDAVRGTSEFARAEAADELIRLPTGDGMALVFFRDAEAPVRCALELSRALRSHPDLKLRMGIHSGPVYRVADINANRNVAGGGINIAQRVMDCGDAGHILVSREVADVLGQLSGWRPMLHDIGEVEVKHGLLLHLHNLYTDETGNTAPPKKLASPKLANAAPELKAEHRITRFRWYVATRVTLLVIALAVSGWFLFSRFRKAQVLSATDTIVVGDFRNGTGDSIFDNTIRQGVIVQLDQSPFLGLISEERLQQVLRSMGKPVDSPLTSELTRELCLRQGSKAYLDGSIESFNGQYILSLRAVNCRTSSKLAEERAEAAEKEDVLKAISQLGRKVREDLGESTDSIRRFDVTLETTTQSLEAFHAYASGWNVLEGRGQYPKLTKEIIEKRRRQEINKEYAEAAVPFFQQAIHWDSNFALGYASLATCYSYLVWGTLASENATKAYQLRDRVHERQRFAIEKTYYDWQELQGHPNVDTARELYATWARTYPRDGEPHRAWGNRYVEVGQYEKALQEFREVIRLEPEETETNMYTISILFYLNRFSEIGNNLEKLRAKDCCPEYVHLVSYQLAFLQSDVAGMSREIAWASDKQFAYIFYNIGADTAAYFGKLAEARELSQRAKQSAKQNNLSYPAWDAVAEMVLREALLGNIEEGRRAGPAFDDYPSFNQETLALAQAFAGETIKPRSFAEKTEEKDLWLTAIQAQIWLNEKNPVKAVELLESFEPYKLIEPGVEYAIYIRAYANLAVPHIEAARADFQEILDHRGAVGNSLVGALAHVGLARACVVQRDIPAAKLAYENFFTLWKDADPDIPILVAAKAEYTKLK